MYSTLPTFLFGFHGCDQSVADAVIRGNTVLLPSENDYDWLGHGIYFWENDPHRALEYAQLLQHHPMRGHGSITQPAVIGAVIDPGHCLNLMEAVALDLLKTSYVALRNSFEGHEADMPRNIAVHGSSDDLLLRRLDCAVIELVHQESLRRSFDTVRGLFFEGGELYPNAGFRARNHIQVCVRNPNCIKGYFLPREADCLHPVP